MSAQDAGKDPAPLWARWTRVVVRQGGELAQKRGAGKKRELAQKRAARNMRDPGRFGGHLGGLSENLSVAGVRFLREIAPDPQ